MIFSTKRTLIVLGEGNLWLRFRLFIQFLALWSMDETVGKLDNRAEWNSKLLPPCTIIYYVLMTLRANLVSGRHIVK